MADYDINIRSQFIDDMYVETPFFRDTEFDFYYKFGDSKKRLLKKLNGDEFAGLKNNSRFIKLLERANDMKD